MTNAIDFWGEVEAKLSGKLTFNFKSAGVTKEIELRELATETIATLLDYGTRKLNDKVNSLYAANPEPGRAAYVERVWKEAIEGKLGERRMLVSGNAGLRNYIFTFLKSQNVPAKKIEALKGLTPEKIVETVWSNKDPAHQAAILAELQTRYEESLKVIDGLDIDF